MPNYDVVLLDADMTLLDFARSEREALARALEKWDLPRSPEVLAAYSKINDALWAALARGEIDHDFLGRERFAALMRAFGGEADPAEVNRDYAAFLGEAAYLLPGAMEFCQAMKDAGLTLALATNGLPAAQRGRFFRTGLDRCIDHLFISMELGAKKPQPEFFDRALERLGAADRRRVVMVGDGLDTDILGANRAGLDCVWYNPAGLENPGPARPTRTAETYGEILAFLGV